MKHWIPLTYQPKIPGVLSGKIRQTIRTGQKYRVGDEVAFHGWEGKPYRSRWSFRTRYFPVKQAKPVVITPDGICLDILSDYPSSKLWVWEKLGWLAKADGIVPGTGDELYRVLSSYHKIPGSGIHGQTLRW